MPADIIVAQKRASTPIKGGARHGNSHNTISMRVDPSREESRVARSDGRVEGGGEKRRVRAKIEQGTSTTTTTTAATATILSPFLSSSSSSSFREKDGGARVAEECRV